VLLGTALRGRLKGLEGRQILETGRRAVIGVVPMALVVYLTVSLLTGGSVHNGIRQLVALVAAVILGAITYIGVERLLHSEELAVVMSVIRRDRARVEGHG